MHSPEELLVLFEKKLAAEKIIKEPRELYEPVKYILSLGGKRIRPVMLLMSCEMFRGDIDKAMPAALGIEMFHNFSLVHDDIMDRAPIRRGQPTVHTRWDTNTAILSGDTMLVLAYAYFQQLDELLAMPVSRVFGITAKEVCEGQQFDMNFESLPGVTINEYLEMIRLKTAVLIGASFKIGSMIAGASEADRKSIYDFGINAGMAFQLMDDLLDSYGDEEKFGKRQYGDIHTNKKTFLYLKALELSDESQKKILKDLYSSGHHDPGEKVREVIKLFDALDIHQHTEKMIGHFHDKAIAGMQMIGIPQVDKQCILDFTEKLMERKH